VVRPGDRLELDRHARGPQRIGQADALVVGYPGVFLAVLQEERRRAGVDMRHRAGGPRPVEVLTDRAAQQVGLEGVGGVVVERGEVGDRVPADDAGHRGGVGDQRCERSQVAAARRAPQIGPLRDHAEVAGVGL
jgi:hypothetical protein